MELMPVTFATSVRTDKDQKKKLRQEWRFTSLKGFTDRLELKITVDPLGRPRRPND
jgi:hypothetical protein